jgi:hypothetical protein
MSVGVGAIVLIDEESRGDDDRLSRLHSPDVNTPHALLSEPLAFMDLFGRSLVERIIERFASLAVEKVSVLFDRSFFPAAPTLPDWLSGVSLEAADEVWVQAALTLRKYCECGIDYAFVARSSSYIESDLTDLLQFHRERHATITRACDADGPLDLWVVNCNAVQQPLDSFWNSVGSKLSSFPGSYMVQGYAKRIAHDRDLRQLVTDSFLARCHLLPAGREVRPGVWIEQDAQIHSGARIVAPAYLGHGVTICENTLVTRCSSVERSSYIDCGTAIEDTSVLPNTYIGISLDVCHSMVYANRLLNLEKDVVVESSDPNLFRANVSDGEEKSGKLGLVDLLGLPHEQKQGETVQERACFVKGVPTVNTTTEFES